MNKVLAICLDGYEPSLGIELMRQGQMPALQLLAEGSARFELDHGAELRTGLAGEHFATGLSPAISGRLAAVHFDRDSYEIWQEGTSLPPFPAGLPLKTVVFDTTYFDLQRASNVQGMVNWGAHDPGAPASSRPGDLIAELIARFGEYPAKKWIYGLPWNSVDDCREMGNCLTKSVDTRADIAEWLFCKRLPDWDLALLTVSEAHSVIEGLWHGVDSDHPLYRAPSAQVAGEGVRNVYRAIDRLIARLRASLPDVAIVLFSMHGMGPNGGDAANLLLLAELLYRYRFEESYFRREGESLPGLNDQVELPPGETWVDWVGSGFPTLPAIEPEKSWRHSPLLPWTLRRILQARPFHREPPPDPGRIPINWIPATRYRPFWPQMRAFCLPAYYDGRVRINLQGRESNGVVPLDEYDDERERIVRIVSECRDATTGRSVVKDVELTDCDDPCALGETEADIVFVWQGAPYGFQHPRFGRIGPVPYRRTGGHTGGYGFAYLTGTALAAGDYGLRSSFDVVPTLLDILGTGDRKQLSGASLLTGNPP